MTIANYYRTSQGKKEVQAIAQSIYRGDEPSPSFKGMTHKICVVWRRFFSSCCPKVESQNQSSLEMRGLVIEQTSEENE